MHKTMIAGLAGLVVTIGLTAGAAHVSAAGGNVTSLYDLTVPSLAGAPVNLSTYKGKVTLVVNVASKCGYTPQYTGLEQLHREFASKGFSVLGFPSNEFGGQEPGTADEIATFCRTKYDVTFPLFAKVDVNGEQAHPLYAHMKAVATQPDGPGEVSWNFAKFLVDRDGNVIARFKPKEDPTGERLSAAIQAALG